MEAVAICRLTLSSLHGMASLLPTNETLGGTLTTGRPGEYMNGDDSW